MGGMGMDKVSVPMNVIDGKKFSGGGYGNSRGQKMNVHNAMCDGFY